MAIAARLLSMDVTPIVEHEMTALDDARARLTEALMRTGEEDENAFREVYRMTCGKLFGICLRICGQKEAAEDVLHEVYLTIWKRAGAFEPGRASPVTWLATIARNRAIDWRRSQPARALLPISAALPVPDSTPSASETLERTQQTHRLHECLEALEQSQREAIRTAFFDGVTYAELASRNDVPLGTMKSRVRRGLGRLKDCLEQ